MELFQRFQLSILETTLQNNKQIKNIILDMGNVLLDYDPERILDTFCDIEEAREVITKELFEGPEWIMADEGKIHEEDKYVLVKERVPEQYHEALRKCAEGWPETMIPVDGARDFVELIKNKGYGVYVLSNAADNLRSYFFRRFLPENMFDGVVVSAEVKMVKPDKEIYDYILEKYNLIPEECLFIDDRADNIDAAKKIGINGHLFRNDYDIVINNFIN